VWASSPEKSKGRMEKKKREKRKGEKRIRKKGRTGGKKKDTSFILITAKSLARSDLKKDTISSSVGK
jgi:hypothetical protein